MFGPKREELKQGQEEDSIMKNLNSLYWSLNVVKILKWRMSWAGYVARMGNTKCIQNYRQKASN
jgi:hypothetical protein